MQPRVSLYHRPVFWFLAALLVRLPYLTEQASTSPLFHQLLLDERELSETARGILSGQGFGQGPLFKAPLYPVFLAGVMWVSGAKTWFWLARLIQHLCGALLAVIAFDTARRLTSGPSQKRGQWAGMLAAGAVAFYGPLIRLEGQILLDFFTVFLQSAMLWALVRMKTTRGSRRATKWAALAGFLAMLSYLNRPTILPVLPFLAWWTASPIRSHGTRKPASLTKRSIPRRWLRAAIFLLLPAAGMLCVGVRNKIASGDMMTMPWQGGYNFYQANRAGASGRYLLQPDFVWEHVGNPTEALMAKGYSDAANSGKGEAGRRSDAWNINHYWYAQARKEIVQSPLRWLGLMWRKAFYLLSEREIYNIEDYDFQKELSTVLKFAPVGFGYVWPLALASLAMLRFVRRGRRRLHGLMWLYLVLFGGAVALFFTSGRFRMPLMFPAVVLGASGLAHLLGRWRAPQTFMKSTRLFYLMLFACGVTLSWTDWWGVRSEMVWHFECDRLSTAFWRAGDPQRALDYADQCERLWPGYATVPLLRGEALCSLGRYEEAEQALRKSWRVLPRDPVAPFNLGILYYYDMNRPEEAVACFEESFKRQPTYDKGRWKAALANLRLGKTDRARELLAPWTAPPQQEVSGKAASPRDEDFLIPYVGLCLRERNVAAAREGIKELEARFGDAGLKHLEEELNILGLDKTTP